MLAGEELEHQKVQRWLEKSNPQIVGSTTRLLCSVFMTLEVTTGVTRGVTTFT